MSGRQKTLDSWISGSSRSQQKDNINKKSKNKRKKKKNTQHKKQSNTIQKTLTGHSHANDNEDFGDPLTKKQDTAMRVVLQNVGRLPSYKHHSKSIGWLDFIISSQTDVALMTEVGLRWNRVDPGDQWNERLAMKFRASRSVMAYNSKDQDDSVYQFGGVGITITDEMAHRVVETGKDPYGMGRWAWSRIRGQEGVHTRTVSVYRPCQIGGPESVGAQHRRVMSQLDRDEDPRAAVYRDLGQDVEKWLADGDNLIIGIDANEDIRTGDTKKAFEEWGLREAIISKFGAQAVPATYHRNENRIPIDGLWHTPGIEILKCGYLGFGEGCPNADHRVLWADFATQDVLGCEPPPLTQATIRKLLSDHPKLAEIYIKEVTKQVRANKLDQQLADVADEAEASGWNDLLEESFNDIHRHLANIRHQVEGNLRKIYHGKVPWSPQLSKLRQQIELWNMIVKKRRGLRVSTKRIGRFMRKTGEHAALEIDLTEAIRRQQLAYKEYRTNKSHAPKWREDFMVSLATAKAKKMGLPSNKNKKFYCCGIVRRNKEGT